MRRMVIGLLFIMLWITGCSNKQIYEGIQQNRQYECEKLVAPQREECLRQHSESYEDYQRSREELLND